MLCNCILHSITIIYQGTVKFASVVRKINSYEQKTVLIHPFTKPQTFITYHPSLCKNILVWSRCEKCVKIVQSARGDLL